jgi:hypothetical protein
VRRGIVGPLPGSWAAGGAFPQLLALNMYFAGLTGRWQGERVGGTAGCGACAVISARHQTGELLGCSGWPDALHGLSTAIQMLAAPLIMCHPRCRHHPRHVDPAQLLPLPDQPRAEWPVGWVNSKIV